MKKILIAITVFLVFAAVTMAHKDASVSSSSAGSYDVSFGKIPVHSFEGADESVFLQVTDSETNDPARGLNVVFTVYKDVYDVSNTASGSLVGKFSAVERSPGLYSTDYSIVQTGNYLVHAQLSQNGNAITEMSKTFSVEPNGPSLFFWLYMLLALIAGAFIASKSHIID